MTDPVARFHHVPFFPLFLNFGNGQSIRNIFLMNEINEIVNFAVQIQLHSKFVSDFNLSYAFHSIPLYSTLFHSIPL